jgi:hypothetical protein
MEFLRYVSFKSSDAMDAFYEINPCLICFYVFSGQSNKR